MSAPSIFITGAAAGIGAAAARLFHARGYLVGLYDVDTAGAEKLAGELGERARHGGLDVRDADAFCAAVGDFVAGAGRLDVMLNNAGVLRIGGFEEVSRADHALTVDVNVMGVLHGVEASLPHLRATAKVHGVARLINMSSTSAIYGAPGFASYSASKFFVRGLTEALNIELEDDGVWVCDVMPHFVDTPMLQGQAERSTIFQKSGFAHSADDIAGLIWEAAEGKALHTFGTASLRAGDRFGRLAPGIARRVMQRNYRN